MDVISLDIRYGIQSRFQMSGEENTLVSRDSIDVYRCRSRLFSNSSHLEGKARIIYYTHARARARSIFFPIPFFLHHSSYTFLEYYRACINFTLYFDAIKSRNRIISCRNVYIAIHSHFIAHVPRSNIILILHCQ